MFDKQSDGRICVGDERENGKMLAMKNGIFAINTLWI
jgi:hypothetical protein